MPKQILTEEYDYLRSILRDEGFADDRDTKTLISKLKTLLGSDGPDKAHASSLDTLRDYCERGLFQRLFGSAKNKESAGILTLAGGAGHLDRKAAALKTLRHFRLMTKFGGHSLWLLSLPKDYRAWLTDEFSGLNKVNLTSKLGKTNEYFTKKEMRDLTSSSQRAASWANKAMSICSNTKGVGAEKAETLVKRWFADESQDDADITTIKGALRLGFQKIAVAATSGKMIFTDNPFHRGTEYEESEAYVWYDRLNVVYIEKDFFGNQNLLTGPTNWARIIVHELSHSQLDTDDVRYAWHASSISPKAGSFSTADALNNADSWAYFAADANGALSQKNRNDALVRS
ncbi:MAG: M35 family metallo-endopeptidase [Pseudomonadota bacterium]